MTTFEIVFLIIGFLSGHIVTMVYDDLDFRKYQQDYKIRCAKLETQIKCLKGDVDD